MCGLSGVAGSITGVEEEVAADLLFYNTLRGPDATGVATVEKHKNHVWEIAKATVPAYTFFDMKRYEKVMKGSHCVILQHNRKATVGGRGETFAHPWDFSHIVGAHNGTVNMSDIKKLPGQKDAVSDSYAILKTIDALGPLKAMAELEEWSTNAWALTWYDREDHSINFLRNSQRPLHFCFNSHRDTIYWSSEAFDLAAAILKNKVKRPDGEKCFMVMPDQHYKFLIPAGFGEKFSAPVMTPVKYKKYVSTYKGGSGTSPFPTARTQTTPTTGSGITGCDLEDREQSPFCDFDFSDHSRGTPKVEILKGDVAIRDENSRKSSLGKDKFPLLYQDDNVRIYLDSNTGKFHRYWWSEHTEQWNAYAVTGVPPEIASVDIVQAVKDKTVHKNNPISNKGPAPTAPPKIPDDEQLRFNGQYITVTKIKDVKSDFRWVLYSWDFTKKIWNRVRSETPPPELPDHQLDINSNHAFTHSGKRKNRKVFFKGFNGKRLDQKEFNKLTSCGCINCKRKSQWTDGRRGGVMVHFVSPNYFLCAYCAEDKTLLKEALNLAKDETEAETEKRTIN